MISKDGGNDCTISNLITRKEDHDEQEKRFKRG